jgi:anaerobic selenocysteine-containing dehydrogenase
MALMNFAQSEPRAMQVMPFVLAKTLGKELESANLAALWGLLMTAPKQFQENAARAGFTPGMTLGKNVFKAIMDHPQGIWVGRLDPEKNMEKIRNEDSRINISIPELADWVRNIDTESEKKALEGDNKFPLVLSAGLHMDTNANTLMRNPAWNKDRRACTVAMHPKDAEALNLQDGRMVKVTTEAGEVTIELQVTQTTRPGLVVIPHGFGLEYNGVTYGANVNHLTKNTHRDRLAGTPIHRYVPCKVATV